MSLYKPTVYAAQNQRFSKKVDGTPINDTSDL